MFDRDGDGTVTIHELGSVMNSLGRYPTDAELQDIINEFDLDGNGVIDFKEFIPMMESYVMKDITEDELLECFKVFDRDHNGYITLPELENAMLKLGEKLTEEECKAMLKEADVNGDGKIDYKEFVKLLSEWVNK